MQDILPPVASPSAGLALGARLRASGIHLGLCLIVAALAAALVFGLWYPPPFREISGGRDLFLIVVAVDIVLGPLITFAVFDRRKRRSELRRDLACVVLLQLAGLGYGLWTVIEARPLALALEGGRLRVVRAIDLDPGKLAKAPPEWRRLPWHGVIVVAARPPQKPDEQLEAIHMALAGLDIGMRPELWLPKDQTAAAILSEARPLAELQRRFAARSAELQRHIQATGRSAAQLKFLPLLARRTDWVALIDAGNGSIVGYAPFDGF